RRVEVAVLAALGIVPAQERLGTVGRGADAQLDAGARLIDVELVGAGRASTAGAGCAAGARSRRRVHGRTSKSEPDDDGEPLHANLLMSVRCGGDVTWLR